MKIAITTSSFAEQDSSPLDLLHTEFSEVRLNPYGRALTSDELIAILNDCDGVLAGTEPYTKHVFAALPGLKVISRCGAGMDSIDNKAAGENNVAVFNTPDGPSAAVAELTLALAMDLARRISQHDRNFRAGIWKKRLGRLLAGQKVGVIGYGRIGRRVATIFKSLGCEVAIHDPYVDSGETPNIPLEKMLTWCDGLTLHCPPPADGVLLKDEDLRLMKPEAWLINAARGGLVDETALYEALLDGRLAGAALDVFGREPYEGPLSSLDNIVLTPHIGSYARESRISMEMEASENLIKGLKKT